MRGKIVCAAFALAMPGVWGSPTARGNSLPVVSNVTAGQRWDASKLVDIHYDLADADGDASTVIVEVSDDGGATWTVPVTAVTGAIGSGVTPGVGKLIVWDCRADLPGVSGNPYKVKICADDGQNHIPSGMTLIPAGEFHMGDTFNEGGSGELPVHAVYVDAFQMDTYEVTNQQYADALNWAKDQGGLITVPPVSGVVYKYSDTNYPYCNIYPTYSYSRITWNGSTFGVTSGKENHPMVMVSWYGAAAYANWRSAMQSKPLSYDLSTWECNWGSGYRLPTEAEWEKAARGGAAGHRFPWSDSDYIQHARANYYSSSSYSYDTSPTRGYHPTFKTEVPYTSSVGYFAANGYGLYDMAGNAYEWCNDRYLDTYYESSPYNNPRGPASGTLRVLRGGSWGGYAASARCAYRGIDSPGSRDHNGGLRLALNSEDGMCGESALFPIDNRVKADLDLDGDVDGFDFLTLVNCYNGSNRTPLPACESLNADFEGDSDVDGFDFLTFANCYNGSNRPPLCP